MLVCILIKMVMDMERIKQIEDSTKMIPPHTSYFSRERTNHLLAYVFVVPSVLFFFLLIAFPLVQVVWDSFQFKHLLNKSLTGFAGWDNYMSVMKHENFTIALKNTFIWTFVSVIGEYILGIISALALNQRVKGRAIFRGMIIIPWVVPIVVAGLTWQWILAPDFGILNIILVKLGIMDKPYYWLGEVETALLAVTFVNIWRSFPFYTISLLAALQSVPKDIIEAAAIDGAGVWTRFIKIILPQLKSVSLVLVFIHIIWTAINFDFIWVMTEGGPFNATETLPIMIYRFAMKNFEIGSASALASMMLAMMLVGFTLYYVSINRKKEQSH
jgi:multiple sugar transport system permease protein